MHKTSIRWLPALIPVVCALSACADSRPRDRARVSGQVEATSVEIAGESGGRLVELTKEEGDRVRRNDVVARFDTRDIDFALQRAAAEREQAVAQLKLLQAGARPEEIRQAAAQVESARAETSAAEAELKAAEMDLERFEQLLRSNSGSQKQRDDAATRRDVGRLRVEAAREREQAARENLARLRAGARAEEIQAARARVAVGDAQIAALQKNLDDLTVRAPVDGVVTEKLAQPGEVVAPRTPLLVVIDLDHAWAEVFVDEPDVPRLRLGQPATLYTDAGGPGIPGKVSFISSKAEFTPRNVQTAEERSKLVYRVKIAVDNREGVLKEGMPVEAEIPFQSQADRTPVMTDAAIAFDRVEKRYGHTLALRGLSAVIGRGEMFGLIGPDGAGKTTTVRLMCGLIRPEAGTIRVLGRDPAGDHHAITREVGYLSQRFSLYGDLSIDENLAFFAEIHGLRRYQSRRDRLLEITHLTPFRTRLADRLSGGMKQKLALACTLIHEPQLLILDEPTTGVDPVSRREFWMLLAEFLSRGITIVMATPYLDEAERCSRVALIHEGQALAIDTPAVLRSSLPGQVVEIVTDPPDRAAALAGSQAHVEDVQLFGERVHVRLSPQAPPGEIDRLRAAFVAAGARDFTLRPIPTSLEDVFIARIAREGR